MRKTLILSLVLLFLIVSTLFLVGNVFILTGENIKDFDYVWTTALCEKNGCKDYEVVCLNGEAIRMDAVSGVVAIPDNWEDLREEKELCK
jgi:hypothetical protein